MGLGSSGQVCASNTHLSTRRGDALIWRLPRIASAADTRLTLTADLYLAWEGDASGNQFDIELGQHPPLAVSFASQPSIQRWSNGEMEALFLPTYAPARAHMSGILLLSVPRAYLEPEGQRLVLDAVKSAVVMRVAVLPSIYTVDVLRSYLRGK